MKAEPACLVFAGAAAIQSMRDDRAPHQGGANRHEELHVDSLLPPSPEEAKRRGLTEIDLYEATEYGLGILRAVLMAFRLPFRIGQCMEMKGTP